MLWQICLALKDWFVLERLYRRDQNAYKNRKLKIIAEAHKILYYKWCLKLLVVNIAGGGQTIFIFFTLCLSVFIKAKKVIKTVIIHIYPIFFSIRNIGVRKHRLGQIIAPYAWFSKPWRSWIIFEYLCIV